MRRLHTSILILFLMVIVTSFVYADTISKPHTFTAGTTAKASEVNANFDTVYNRVNQLNRVVIKDDGQEMGTFVSLDSMGYAGSPITIPFSNFIVPPAPGPLLSFITSKGYLVTITHSSVTGNYDILSSAIYYFYFESSNCTGTRYFEAGLDSIVGKDPYGAVYYIPAGTEASSITYNSKEGASGCTEETGTTYLYEMLPNSESVTGVPDSGYSGPVTIRVE